jgi:hypothetical protein
MPVPPPKVTVTGALPKGITRWLTPEEAPQWRTEAKRPLPLTGKLPPDGKTACDLGRGGRIRTGGLFVPNEARYQAAPHPARTGPQSVPYETWIV